MLAVLQALAGFVAGFIVGAGVLAALFGLMGRRVPAELALPLGVLVLWGSAVAGSWIALG